MGDSILDHPDLRGLDDLERANAAEELKTPEGRMNLLLRTTLALRADAKAAREHCAKECAPVISRRLRSLERFRWLLLGGLAVILVTWGIARSIYGGKL